MHRAEDHKHEELIEAACSSLSVNETALLFARIDFYISASQWQKALETLKKLEARSAEFSTRVSRQMVAALTGLNRLEEAEAYYKKHLQYRLSLDSQLWTSYRTIFGVFVAGRQLDKALATLDGAKFVYCGLFSSV
jgi:tetratricopeptide (TPR) repeat protein